MPLSPCVLQLPIPSIFFLIPPSHAAQWVIRLVFLFYTCTIAIPIILLLVPLSVALATRNNGQSPLLSLHPDNLPPRMGIWGSILRGYMVYIVGTLVWAITGVGNAPESDIHLSRRLTRWVCRFVQLFTSIGVKGQIKVDEEVCEALEDRWRIGVLSEGTAGEVIMFSMKHLASDDNALPKESAPIGRERSTSTGKAIMFLAGGGYVTGVPLAHPFVCSLIRQLPGGYTIYAPFVRKSLNKERSFPVPLLDALVGYQHLRKTYEASDIIVMGDSAGGGLCWSLTAYLAILREVLPGCDLGVPGLGILISPWLALPPTLEPEYPDLVDEPQLLNAARCYMARYPILKDRPDPFTSDPIIWPIAMRQVVVEVLRSSAMLCRRVLPRRLARRLNKLVPGMNPRLSPLVTVKDLPEGRQGDSDQSLNPSLIEDWLDQAVFERLSSHHPLVSPATNTKSPFVRNVLRLLAEDEHGSTRMMVYVGTAEWFYRPAMEFVKMAKKQGVQVDEIQYPGGFHAEGCVLPGELGGSAGKLVETILTWLSEE